MELLCNKQLPFQNYYFNICENKIVVKRLRNSFGKYAQYIRNTCEIVPKLVGYRYEIFLETITQQFRPVRTHLFETVLKSYTKVSKVL